MKSKFQNFGLGSMEVLSQAEQHKVKGGYPDYGQSGGIQGGTSGGGTTPKCYLIGGQYVGSSCPGNSPCFCK